MNDITVLMYHAVLANPATVGGADAHYAVSARDFETHIDTLVHRGFAVRSVCDWMNASGDSQSPVALTFDDGHSSNYETVFPLLADRGLTGDFFVNPTTIETKSFISWKGLREMSDAGMSIQSHGHTHGYLDDMRPERIAEELSHSKKEIEDRLGRAVDLFAPPHGRYNNEVVRIARQSGYRAICCSRPGRWRRTSGVYEIPRLAVLSSTTLGRLNDWARGEGVALMEFRYRLLGTAKAALGNRNYERLRELLLRSGGGS